MQYGKVSDDADTKWTNLWLRIRPVIEQLTPQAKAIQTPVVLSQAAPNSSPLGTLHLFFPRDFLQVPSNRQLDNISSFQRFCLFVSRLIYTYPWVFKGFITSCNFFKTFSSSHLVFICLLCSFLNAFALCNGIQGTVGCWIPRLGFRIPCTVHVFAVGTCFLDSNR